MLVDEGLELLEESECRELLARGSIGRVGVSIGALPAIFPVNYVVADDAVVFRTGQGTKLEAATDHAVVAFEVDDFDRLHHCGWSVLVMGTANLVTNPAEEAVLRRLPLRPWAGGRRWAFVRVPIVFISGRRIVHGPVEGT
ncbi:MAG TPA: pyridoxamine 5'-phosphate oxidase family protein [Acidimicrobiales bacterium]|nr:pyridoxamine 5'-phosphate oxidase family protein [Acidimicrobiales bacterium]